MDALERGPFGQALSLWLHRLPRDSGQDWDWEIDRGFHLQVLGPSLFELNLRPRSAVSSPSLKILPGSSVEGVTKLLIWNRSSQDQDWEAFARCLNDSVCWRAGLILSPLCQRTRVLREHFRLHSLWAPVVCPVVHLFQDTPPAEDYFSVEKNLFVLGRVGRRLKRYARWRRCLPW